MSAPPHCPPTGAESPASVGEMVDDRPGGAAEARLEEIAPGYLAKVRSAAAALAVDADGSVADLGAQLAAVRDAGHFDLDVPTASNTPAGHYLKAGVKRATSWYLRYLTAQFGAFGAAVSAMGEAAAARLARVEDAEVDIVAGLDQLRRRVERLEARVAAAAPSGEPEVPPVTAGGAVSSGAQPGASGLGSATEPGAGPGGTGRPPGSR